MTRLFILTDIDGIWIHSDQRRYLKLSDKFLRAHKLDKDKIKIADSFFNKFRNYARVGLIDYKNLIEIYFKIIDPKRYKMLSKEYIEFERKIIKKYLSPDKYALTTLRKLKKLGIKLIGISDYIKPSKIRREELKILKIGKYFDKIYTSHDLGCEKPKAFEKFTNSNKRIIFIGHDDDELIGAKKYGLFVIGLNNKQADINIKSLKEIPNILRGVKLWNQLW